MIINLGIKLGKMEVKIKGDLFTYLHVFTTRTFALFLMTKQTKYITLPWQFPTHWPLGKEPMCNQSITIPTEIGQFISLRKAIFPFIIILA
jgi:hypothetical protein